MADDELFDDLDEFSDLDETPSFDFEDDITVPDFGEEEGGVSRAFKVVGALLVLAVLAIVALIVLFALDEGDRLSVGDQTNTAVAKTNVAIEFQYNATLTALAQIEQASQTAVRNVELTATGEAIVGATQRAVSQTQTAGTATAEFEANQALAAAQTQTQEAMDVQATALAATTRIFGRVADQQGRTFGGVTLRLYRDDGDGVFSPSDRILAPAEGPAATVEALSYGLTVESTLAAGEVAEWTFPGIAGDVVSIAADASDTRQMDMFIELLGPGGAVLVGDDDSGDDNNALINEYSLPQDGTYTIRVSSVAGPGSYALTLSLAPGAADEGVSAQPSAGDARASGYVLAQLQATPTPELGDILIEIIETTAEGEFDFGALDPGIYWLELDYDTLPPELQALVPPGEPLVIQVIVPISGQVEFVIGEFFTGTVTPLPTITMAPPTATDEPTLNAIAMTATAYSLLTRTPIPMTPSPTGTPLATAEATLEGVSPTPSATALPETGFFSDLADSGGMGGTSGLTVLAIAAVGLLAVVVVARRLRTAP